MSFETSPFKQSKETQAFSRAETGRLEALEISDNVDEWLNEIQQRFSGDISQSEFEELEELAKKFNEKFYSEKAIEDSGLAEFGTPLTIVTVQEGDKFVVKKMAPNRMDLAQSTRIEITKVPESVSSKASVEGKSQETDAERDQAEFKKLEVELKNLPTEAGIRDAVLAFNLSHPAKHPSRPGEQQRVDFVWIQEINVTVGSGKVVKVKLGRERVTDQLMATLVNS